MSFLGQGGRVLVVLLALMASCTSGPTPTTTTGAAFTPAQLELVPLRESVDSHVHPKLLSDHQSLVSGMGLQQGRSEWTMSLSPILLRRTRRLVLLALLVALITSATALASQGEVEEPPEDGALELQAEWYSSRYGVTVDEATRRIEARAAMDQALLLIAEGYPGSYAGAILHHDDFHLEIRFVGDVPPSLENSLGDDSPELVLKGGSAISARDLFRQAERISERVPPTAQGMVVVPELVTGSISVTIQTRSGNPQLEVGSLLAAEARESNVSVSYTRAPVGVEDHTYGGAKTFKYGETGYCTTGFTVSGSEDGVLTAGHCSNSRTYEEYPGATPYTLTFKGQYVGYYGDVQWHSSSHVEYDDFYYQSTTRQDVSGVKSASTFAYGDTVCRYGRKTGNDCYELAAWNVSKYMGDPYYTTMYKLACGNSRKADGGDSGGPWYSGGIAWGIHQGSVSFTGVLKDCFTPADYVDDALGVTIKTTT